MPHDEHSPSSGEASAAEIALDPRAAERQIEERVVSVARELAEEVAGDRAGRAVTATASFERDIGLGSLERVELLTRLEAELGRNLGERFLMLDSAREIARAAATVPVSRAGRAASSPRESATAAVRVDDVSTLADALYRRAAAEPNRVHVVLHTDTGIHKVRYAELWDGAARIASALRERGVRRGDPVAIMLPTGLDYLQSFMGVVAGGGIAVPLYPPARLDRIADYLQRQAKILANANATVLIAMEEAVPIARLLHRDAPALESIVTASALRKDAEPLSNWEGTASDAAVIQYTSGSTGDPKGVVLTHDNLLANMRAIASGVQMSPTDAIVSWLPLYHDMGLIGAWLNALVHGIPLTLMSPLAFLARPERWLWAIHEQRATLSPAPNFAFELCVRRIRDDALAGLDLSSWRIASNGSEAVSIATLDRFAERFAPFGFKREALLPVYGLAESSVALCFPPMGRPPLVDVVERGPFEHERRAVAATSPSTAPITFVSVGVPLPGHDVRIVDEERRAAPDRVVGRLEFRGPSCTSGYYRNPEATRRLIAPDGWLDSGDLAYRANGELFITGRIKDLIIKGGRNLVPHEIEEAVGAVGGIRKGCVAAFGVTDAASGTERLVVLAESRMATAEEIARLEQEVVRAVAASTGVPPDVVRIVPPGAVPKTSSGKIRRNAARDAFERGDLGRAPGAPWSVRLALALSVAGRAARRAGQRVARGAQMVYLAVAWLVALVVLGPVVALLFFALPAGRPMRGLARFIARVMLGVSGCRIDVDGAEHLPRRGPLVLVCNHASYVDTPLLLAALPVDFVFVAMNEVLTWPVVGRLVRRGEHVTVDRWHMRQSVDDAAAVERRLRAGDAVLFFPEGGFARARGLRAFRFGAFESAAVAGAPVVPIALRGAREVLPDGGRFPRPRRLHVWVGEPMYAAGSDWPSVLALRARAANAIAAHCGEPRMDGSI
ncbi:MAG TPA: AMP-binding protein [Gemmatimonadaceae bacterium]|nr:AMP-binding protein [Gemmatimonadaceae bacterium]